MKRFLLIALAPALLVVLAACSSENPENAQEEVPESLTDDQIVRTLGHGATGVRELDEEFAKLEMEWNQRFESDPANFFSFYQELRERDEQRQENFQERYTFTMEASRVAQRGRQRANWWNRNYPIHLHWQDYWDFDLDTKTYSFNSQKLDRDAMELIREIARKNPNYRMPRPEPPQPEPQRPRN